MLSTEPPMTKTTNTVCKLPFYFNLCLSFCVLLVKSVCFFVSACLSVCVKKGEEEKWVFVKKKLEPITPNAKRVHCGYCWRIHACIYNPSTSAFLKVQSHMAAHTVLSAHSASYCVTWSMETLLVRVKQCWIAVCLPWVLICSVKSSKVKWLSQNRHFMSPCPHPLQLRMHSPNFWVTPTLPASGSMSSPSFPPLLLNGVQIFSQCTAALYVPWPSWWIHPELANADLLSWLHTDVSGSVWPPPGLHHPPTNVVLRKQWKKWTKLFPNENSSHWRGTRLLIHLICDLNNAPSWHETAWLRSKHAWTYSDVSWNNKILISDFFTTGFIN